MSNLFSKAEIDELFKKHPQLLFNPDRCEKIKNFQIRDSDIFVIGNAKSGTTWIQEMVWLIAKNFDYEGAKVFIDERFPVLEVFAYELPQRCIHPEEFDCHSNSLEFINAMEDPRFIKMHLPINLFPEQLLSSENKAKIIFMARNVKDVCVSSYHHLKYLGNIYNGSFEDFCKLYMHGYAIGSSYWENLLYFWNRRHEERILFIKYEEMIADLPTVIKKVAKFLNKPIPREKEEELTKWLHFDSMKSNSALNHENLYNKTGFIRVGKIGEHKKEMSPEMIEKFDKWIYESIKGTDYEI